MEQKKLTEQEIDSSLENWTPPRLEQKDYDNLMRITQSLDTRKIPAEILLTLFDTLIPYIYKKRILRGKEQWKINERSGEDIFVMVAFIGLMTKQWNKKTERLMENTFNQERIDKIMEEPPVISPIKVKEVKDFFYRLKYPEVQSEVLQRL